MKTALLKYFSLLLIVVGLVIVFRDHSATSEIPLLVGLFTLFIAREKREDERSEAIRSSAALFALIIGYGIKLLTTYLYDNGLLSYQLTSINYFLILVFFIANIVRYARLYIFFR